MSDQLSMFGPGSCEDTGNVISSPEGDSGRLRSEMPGGRMEERSGPEVAPVPASVLPEKVKGLRTLATSGRIGFGSSRSFALQSSLGSKLVQRLDMAGSTLFKMTWRERTTPLGRRYLERAVSVLRTSGSGCTSVPTPMAGSPATETYNAAGNSDYSRRIVELAAVPSPCTPNGGRSMSTDKMDATGRTEDGRKHTASLEHAVKFSAVATPRSEGSQCAGSHRGIADTLHSQANLSAVPTPQVADHNMSSMQDAQAYSERWLARNNAGSNLAVTAQALSAVASPKVRDFKSASATPEFLAEQMAHPRGKDLSVQATYFAPGAAQDGSIQQPPEPFPSEAQLADSGLTATGGGEKTASTGQLNAAFSRWLQGVPIAWDYFAIKAARTLRKSRKVQKKEVDGSDSTATQSLSRSRKSSSAHTSKSKGDSL